MAQRKKSGNCASEMLFSRTTVSRIVKVIRNRVVVAFWLSLLCYFKNGKTTKNEDEVSNKILLLL